jgi:ribose 5-phosphate isomerase B
MEDKLPISSDHGGYELKEFLKVKLLNDGYSMKDYGTYTSKSVDYPDFIKPLAKDVNDGKFPRGIIICGSGNGAQMTANKFINIRAALCWNEEITELARLHNDANILALPGRFVEPETAYRMVKIFLTTDFEGGRHIRRVEKIRNI